MSDIELKPCPFCGCDMPSMNQTTYGTSWINCPDCMACTGGVVLDDKSTPEMAAEAWNQRAT